jgi:hypothetical protein
LMTSVWRLRSKTVQISKTSPISLLKVPTSTDSS